MDCRTFEKIQLASLVGDGSARRLEQARRHGLECDACRHPICTLLQDPALALASRSNHGDFGRNGAGQ